MIGRLEYHGFVVGGLGKPAVSAALVEDVHPGTATAGRVQARLPNVFAGGRVGSGGLHRGAFANGIDRGGFLTGLVDDRDAVVRFDHIPEGIGGHFRTAHHLRGVNVAVGVEAGHIVVVVGVADDVEVVLIDGLERCGAGVLQELLILRHQLVVRRLRDIARLGQSGLDARHHIVEEGHCRARGLSGHVGLSVGQRVVAAREQTVEHDTEVGFFDIPGAGVAERGIVEGHHAVHVGHVVRFVVRTEALDEKALGVRTGRSTVVFNRRDHNDTGHIFVVAAGYLGCIDAQGRTGLSGHRGGLVVGGELCEVAAVHCAQGIAFARGYEAEEFFGVVLLSVVYAEVTAHFVERGACILLLIVGRGRNEAINLAGFRLHHGAFAEGVDGIAHLLHSTGGVSTGGLRGVHRIAEGGVVGLRHVTHFTGLDGLQVAFGLCHHLVKFRIFGGEEVVLGIGELHRVEDCRMALQTEQERGPILLFGGQPSDFGEGLQTGQELIFQLGVVVGSLGPHVALHTEGELRATAEVGERIVVVDRGHAVHIVVTPATAIHFVHVGFAGRHLHPVEIEAVVGAHHALETVVGGHLFGGLIPTLAVGQVPGHDEGLHFRGRLLPEVGLVLGDEFVPHHDLLLILRLQELGEVFYQPGLEFFHTRKLFVLNALAAEGVVLPTVGGTFVTAEVDVLAGEHFGHVAEHGLEEVDHLVVAYVEHVVRDTGGDAHLVLLFGQAREFGIGGQSGYHVTGHIDFGHDLDVASGGVGHDLTQIGQRVVHAATVFRVVEEPGVDTVVHKRTGATATHRSEFGIFGDLDAPALVVRQVPVQAVHLVEGEHVDDALHLCLVEEVARHVEHVAAVAEQGLVVDVKSGHTPIGRGGGSAGKEGGGQQLAERLQTVEETGARRSADFYAVGGDGEFVGFSTQAAIGEQAHGTGFGARTRGFRRHGATGGLAQTGGEVGGQLLDTVGREAHGAERLGIELDAGLHREALRIGDERGELAVALERGGILEADDVVGVVVGQPEAYFLTHAGTAPLVEGEVVVTDGMDFEIVFILFRSLHNKLRVGRCLARSHHHAVLALRGDVELLAEFVGDGTTGGEVALKLPQLCAAAGHTGLLHILCVGTRLNDIAAVDKLDEIPRDVAPATELGERRRRERRHRSEQRHEEKK